MKGEPRLSDSPLTGTTVQSSDEAAGSLPETRWGRFMASSRTALTKCYSMGGVAFIAVALMFATEECADDPPPDPPTTPSNDGGSNDGGSNDGGSNDGGSNDGGSNDGGSNDGGSNDGGSNDGGSNDGGSNDGGSNDGGSNDGGSNDGGSRTDNGGGDSNTQQEQTPEERKQKSWASGSHNRLEDDYDVTTPNSGDDTSTETLDTLLDDLPNTRGFNTDDAQTALGNIKLRPGQTHLDRNQMAQVLCAGMAGCTATHPTAIKRYLERHGITVGTGRETGCTDRLSSGSCYSGTRTLSNDQTVTFLDRALNHQPGYKSPVDNWGSTNTYQQPTSSGPGPSCQNGFTVISAHIDSANGDDGCRPPHCPFGRRSTGWCEIPASDDPPVVYVASPGLVEEDDGSASFVVVLSHPYTSDVTVDVATADGTAIADSDYTAVASQAVTVAAGQRAVPVPVAVIDDTDEEDDETFTLSLSNPTNSATLSPSPQAEATIAVNDKPRRVRNLQASCERQGSGRFYQIDLSWEEPPGHSDIYWYRVAVIHRTTTVATFYTYRTSHSATPELVTTTQNYRFEVTPYTSSKTVDGDPASVELYCGAPQTITFSQAAVTVAEGSSVGVTLSIDRSYRRVDIPLVSTPQGTTVRSDYRFPARVRFEVGDRSKTVTFTARQDADDDHEEVVLSIGRVPGVSAGAVPQVTVTIVDDDAAAGLVVDPTSLDVVENSHGTFTVKLATQPTADVTVTVASDDTGAATVSTTSLTFTTATWNTPQAVTVTGVNDTDDSDENVTVALSASGGGYATHTASVAVAVTDDDKPVTVSFGQASYTVAESYDASNPAVVENQVTVTVTLSADPHRTVVVHINHTPQGGATNADYSGVPASVTFHNGETTSTFTFIAIDDTDEDAGESVQLTFGTLPANVSAGTINEATVTIIDDDTTGRILT